MSESKKEKRLRVKSEIFQHAVNLISEDAFHSYTVRDFCNTAGISTGKFYRHFPSKESLLYYYFELAQERYLEETGDYLSPVINKDNLADHLLNFYIWYAKYSSDYGVVFCSNFFAPKNQAMNLSDNYNAVLSITSEFIIQAMIQGYCLPDAETPDRLSRAVFVLYRAIMLDWCSSMGTYDIVACVKRYMGQHIEVILH